MISFAAMIAAALVTASSVSAAPLRANEAFYGLWRTPVDGSGVVRLEACGERVCGYIVDSPRLREFPDQRDERNRDRTLRNRRVAGMKILEARVTGENQLGDGWLYHPIEGNTYSGSMVLLDNDRLRLTGCVIWPLCSSQVWRRID